MSSKTVTPSPDGGTKARPVFLARESGPERLTEDLDDAARHVFDLAAELPVRCWLFVLGETDHVLLVPSHHIAVDGWSVGPLTNDLTTAYEARCAGSLQFRLGTAVQRRLVTLAKESRATVFMVLQAAIATLFSQLGAGTDIPLGSAAAGRSEEEFEDLVGFFVNTVVLRTDLSGDPTFSGLVRSAPAGDRQPLAGTAGPRAASTGEQHWYLGTLPHGNAQRAVARA
ncbi:condensation domain-containing protein [Streptomyces hokutonensis]|uniref:condensation domain-containing protein n=1 Tax=Streptomyces hokutonensis TaxID=1306990 RepID=UPI0033EB9295